MKRNKYFANTVSIADLLIKLNEEVKVSKKGRYSWKKHSSFCINDTWWYRFSNKTHGFATDLLVEFFGYSETDAINYIYDNFEIDETQNYILYAPKKYLNNDNIIRYLTCNRFIDYEVVSDFIKQNLIYEDSKYHNCNFIGYHNNQIKHVSIRGTDMLNDYKGNIKGSDNNYCFRYFGNSNKLFVFESPIDMLSYISLNLEDWKTHSYLTLCGVCPSALFKMLEDDKYKQVNLCLDNDYAGQGIASEVKEKLVGYDVNVIVPKFKDFNEDLKFRYNQPVLGGIVSAFNVQFNESKNIIAKKSVKEKCKTVKDIFNSVSIFFGHINNNRLRYKAMDALLEISKDALFIVQQQYRHFQKNVTIEQLLNDMILDDCFMSDVDSEKYPKLNSLLSSIKIVVFQKEIYTKENKLELIKNCMELSKLCLTTHTFLKLNKEKK